MKRALTVALATAAVVVLGVVSRSSAQSQKTVPLLRVGFAGSLSTLDVNRTVSRPILSVAALVNESMLRIPSIGGPQPWLAQSVRHPNPFTYVYTLRKGIKFSDGAELTAADVANALNYHRYPGSQAGVPWLSVRSITATNRYTVTITLKRRDASFTWAPARWEGQIFEQNFQNEHKQTFGQPGTGTIGTGPYVVESLDPTRGVELSANPRYWRGKPPIQHISVKLFADETSMALAFRSGEIDLALAITNPQAFESSSGATVIRKPSCNETVFTMNTGVPPFNDVHVRRAVAYALNRADLIKARGGFATPHYTVVPPSQLYTLGPKAKVDAMLKSLPQYPFSLAKAKQEMARSAFPHGFGTTLVEPQADSTVAQAVAAQLKPLGINAAVKIVSFPEYIGAITGTPSQRPNNVADAGCASPDPDYMTYLIDQPKGGVGIANLANYRSPEAEALLLSTTTTSNPAKRLEQFGKLLQRVGTDVPYVPLWVPDSTYAISSKFAWPDYIDFFFTRPWALDIKPQ
jgi:peptide/nickel transport system substrate-binding protein